jgi:CRP/FNR family transcriptional regulator, cyclic AMP receptor protein
LEKILAVLPLTNYLAGEIVLRAGLKTGRLLILKRGAVVVLRDSIEISRADQPGAVFGELSALLDQPHTADVRALEDSQFYVADATLLVKDPIVLLHVARILAQRLVASDRGLIELRERLQAGQPPSVLKQLIENLLSDQHGIRAHTRRL